MLRSYSTDLMILLQSFPYFCPFPSCEFRHLFSRKKALIIIIIIIIIIIT
jgi:hypothetical protein